MSGNWERRDGNWERMSGNWERRDGNWKAIKYTKCFLHVFLFILQKH